MKGWGITFLILGIGSFIMPKMGMQFFFIDIFGKDNAAITGGVFIAIGIVLLILGSRRQPQA